MYTVVDNNPFVRDFVVDTQEDIAEIDTRKILPGSTVFVIATKATYMLKHNGSWFDVSSDEGTGQR